MQQIGAFGISTFGDKSLEKLWDLVPADQNHAFSSLALYIALSAAYLGASGKSAEELKSLLHVNGKDDLAKLRPIINNLVASGVFSVENTAIVGANIPLKPTFEAALKTALDSRISKGGKDDIIDLLSCLTLDAQWQHKFDPKNTQIAPFTRFDGSAFNVDMMYQKKELPTGSDKNFQWVVLGHQSKNPKCSAPVLILFLPKKGINFNQAGMLLKDAYIQTAFERSSGGDDVLLRLPKLFLESVANITALPALAHCFSQEATFSEASDTPLYIKKISLAVKQSWDELGQKVEMKAKVRGATLGIHEDIHMTFDRPFYEVLYDPTSKLVIMRGRIVEPSVAGSKNPGRIPADLDHVIAAPFVTSDKIPEYCLQIADDVLNSVVGIDTLSHGRFKEIKATLITRLEKCDATTLAQISGFMNGPLRHALSEYSSRMLQVVSLVERWSRIDKVRVNLVTAPHNCSFELADLQLLLELLVTQPSYPKPPKFDSSPGNILESTERVIATANPYPNITDLMMLLTLTGASDTIKDASADASLCTPEEELLSYLLTFKNETDTEKLLRVFCEPKVLTWIQGRTKHYYQEVRHYLASYFEPSDAAKASLKQNHVSVPRLWAATKLPAQYFNAAMSEMIRYTYEDGYQGIQNDWDFLLKPRYLNRHTTHESLATPLPFVYSEQLMLANQPDGKQKLALFQTVVRDSIVISLPWEMQLFLRDVWPSLPASQCLHELYAQANELIQNN